MYNNGFNILFLIYLFIFGWAVWHVGSQFLEQGSNLCHLHQKHGFITTGPPEKSPDNGFKHLKNLFHVFMFSQQKTKRHILLDFIKPNFWFRKYHQQACFRIISFSSVQSLGHVSLFATPGTAACQASLSITNSWSLLKFMSIES